MTKGSHRRGGLGAPPGPPTPGDEPYPHPFPPPLAVGHIADSLGGWKRDPRTQRERIQNAVSNPVGGVPAQERTQQTRAHQYRGL